MVAADVLVNLLKEALRFIASSLFLTSYLFEPQAVVQQDCSCYDFIVVGGGTAGCIIASRLAENMAFKVLLIEAGGDPPIESLNAGLFPFLPRTVNDWNYTSVPDPKIAQYTVNKAIELTAGKMLGGSSSLNHVIRSASHPNNYDVWAEIINDVAWNFKNLQPYLQLPENLVDEEILESVYGKYYGKDGDLTITKAHDLKTKKYLEAFEEIAPKRPDNINKYGLLGFKEPAVYISRLSEDGVRQSTATTYLIKNKNKANLHLLRNTEVTRILFDKDKNAIGVVAKNKTGEFEICSTKEVIITAGALNTPKLLMLSGVGPRRKLQKMGIKVVSDLPVGENLQDQVTVPFAFKMAASNKPKLFRDPRKYPAPGIIGYDTLNQTEEIPSFEVTNLIMDHDSIEIPMLTSSLFNYIPEIGEAFFNASMGHEVLIMAVTHTQPKFRGVVELRSRNYEDAPLVYLNILSNGEDLTNIAKYLQKMGKIRNTKYFRSVNAKFVDLDVGCGLMNDSLEFWKCFAKAVGTSCWQYCGTCSHGLVVDNKSKVKGVDRLRVGDASTIPRITTGFVGHVVMGIAEKIADLIKNDN